MASNSQEIIAKENIKQALIIADTFDDEFLPISNDVPLILLPLVNKPLIDYTLEFLYRGCIEETFLFCGTHIEKIRAYINQCIEKSVRWSLRMKVNIIASESCRSFGDCMREMDARGLLRGDFVLIGPGTVSNIKLLPLLERHKSICNLDKGAAMTIVYNRVCLDYHGRHPHDEIACFVERSDRIVYYKNTGRTGEKRVMVPLRTLLDYPDLILDCTLKDTHIAICSSSVLPLFTDNFDFQTKEDFIQGLLMNEETLGSTLYSHVIMDSGYGAAVTNWRMFQSISKDLVDHRFHPIEPCRRTNKILSEKVVLGENATLGDECKLKNCVLGKNVKVGKSVTISDSFIFSNTIIEDKAVVTHSVIDSNCHIKTGAKITAGSILGKNVIIEANVLVGNALVQSTKPENSDEADKLGENAYRLKLDEDGDDDAVGASLARKMSRLRIEGEKREEIEDSTDSEEDDDEYDDHLTSAIVDDTRLFLNEVIDSLMRGFTEKLSCENLVLEINSSRYAYNISVKEVNFNVTKAILTMSLQERFGPNNTKLFYEILKYFAPLFNNYIRNTGAMHDCLQAIEDVALNADNWEQKRTAIVLKFLYDRECVSEDAVLEWATSLDKSGEFYSQVQPFTDWLKEAEEESSSEED